MTRESGRTGGANDRETAWDGRRLLSRTDATMRGAASGLEAEERGDGCRGVARGRRWMGVEQMSRRMSLLLIMLLVAALGLNAQTPPVSMSATMRTTWRAQDGLMENTVQAIQQTKSGYLWVGTTGGAVRFDGAHFSPVASTEGSIFSMLADRDGTVWMGTEGAGLIRVRNGVAETMSAAQGLTDGFVRALLEDRRGRIWVGTDNGLFWVDGDRVRQLDAAAFDTPLSVHALMEDAEGRIWIGGSQALVLRPAATMAETGRSASDWQRYTLPGAFSENRVKSMFQTRDGDLWVGTVGGLDHLVGGRFVRVPGVVGTVRTMLETADGFFWAGTIGHGLYVRQPGRGFARLGAGGQKTINTVLALFEDDSQQLWVGSQDGLLRLRRDSVRIVPLPEDRAPDFATLSLDLGNALWAVSSRVYHVERGVAVAADLPGLKGVTIRTIFRDGAGTLWFGTDGSGVYHQTAAGLDHYRAPQHLVNNFVRGFLESAEGEMWVATDEGISRLRGRQVENLRMSDGLAYFSTRSLMQAKDGTIWIGTERGVSCWQDGKLVQNKTTAALAREKVWSILQTADGALWFGTRDHGLYRQTASGLQHFGAAQGLASDSIYQLLEGLDHRIWLSGPATISSFLPEPVRSGGSEQLAVSVYNLPTGEDGTQMYGGRQPAGAVTKDGTVWFASNRGAVEVLPVEERLRPPPRALITRIVVDGRPLDPASSELDLSQSQSRLEIFFAPLLLRPQAGVRIRYRLRDFDPGWIEAGTAQSISYTSLPAGKYQFEVEVFESDQPGNVSVATLPLRVRPHFYRRWWFVGACLGGVVLLGMAIYRARLRQIRLRFEAVLGERSRLAREMHDTVIQGCTSVSALLEALSSLGEENQPLRADLVEHARVQVRSTIDEARQAVWNLRRQDLLCTDLPDGIEQLAAQVRTDYATDVVVRVEGTSRPIAAFAARELLMVVREAVYNAALHGAPTRVEIVIRSLPETLDLEVRDNGAGFVPDTDKQTLHYGIAGMRERIERLKGEFHLTSEPGRGTVVQARLRLSALTPHSLRSIEL